jgi:putative methyltransferase (TIGR04325 family)
MLRSIYHWLTNLPIVRSARRFLYQKRFDSGRSGLWQLNGYYCDFAQAESARQQLGGKGFAAHGLHSSTLGFFNRKNTDDYPVMYWLRRALETQSYGSLVEFGGHLGAKYSALSTFLELTPEYNWQIVETSDAVTAASVLDFGSHPQLSWLTDIEMTKSADILYCSGCLQYVDTDILDLIEKMPTAPRWLILNRLALCDGPGFATLENFSGSPVAYKVRSHDLHDKSLATDYELIDTWFITAYCVPHVLEADTSIKSIGQVWSRKH